MIAKGDREFNQIVGIDLGGGRGKHTAVAVGAITAAGLEIQSYGRRAPSGLPWYDDELVAFLMGLSPGALVAVDAPLGLPACLRCQLPTCPGVAGCPDPAVRWMRAADEARSAAQRPALRSRKPQVSPYTQRVCEVLLHAEHEVLVREALGQGMGPLTARAAHLVRRLAPAFRRDAELIEVYPRAMVHQAASARAARRYRRATEVWETRAGILEGWSADLTFKTWREESLGSDHCFEAVVCAYTGFRYLADGWTRDPELEPIAALEGWIWRPPA
jgi:predicted nuclease with RNAse H fold